MRPPLSMLPESPVRHKNCGFILLIFYWMSEFMEVVEPHHEFLFMPLRTLLNTP